ncbi:MAG: hypothetical protein ACRENA_06600 [Vulcanimicrobiaceae bacterium]
MVRSGILALLIIAAASQTPKPLPSPVPSPASAHDGGIVHGSIVSIDYFERRMEVRARRNQLVDMYILPSTSIQGKAGGYHSIADLKKGETVDVLTSIEGRRTNAEIIKLE